MSENAFSGPNGQALADVFSARRPSVGKRVRVTQGRRQGVEGVVVWHGRDKFNAWKWRYGDSSQKMAQEISGCFGFRVKIRAEDGSEFYMDADKVAIVVEEAS